MPNVMFIGRMNRLTMPLAAVLFATLGACGSGGGSTAPRPLAPTVSAVNGVPRPTGLVGMTILIEGANLGDAAGGKILFTPVGGGAAVQATIANPITDWSSSFVVTTVPASISTDATITVQTAGGVSNPVPFSLVSSVAFSPNTIVWARTTDLPMALQGLGAAYVPVSSGGARSSYVFTVGGADATNTATTLVYRAQPQSSGAMSAWTAVTALPQARAYQTTVGATGYTAPLDTATTAGYLFAIGGIDAAGQTVNTVYSGRIALDGSLTAWQTTTPLPVAMHSASGAVFRGYVYLVGGATATNAPLATSYRARVHADGTLGAWESLAALPVASGYLALAQFGPYLYAVGGETGSVTPVLNIATGTEASSTYAATINLRDGSLTSAGWTTLSSLSKARSKHSTVAAGGALLTSSGVYGGSPGSSENSYATLNSDGTVGGWQGATGTNTIAGVLGYSLYNEAALSFADATGKGHVLILGGADRATAGKASAAVVYY